MIPPDGEIDELTAWKRSHQTQRYGRTDSESMEFQEGHFTLRHLFLTMAFSPALAFLLRAWAWGFLLPPVHICALLLFSYLPSFLLYFLSFFFFQLYLRSLSLSIPPVKGGKRKTQCIRLSFLLFFFIHKLFGPFSRSGRRRTSAERARYGHAGRAGV